MVQSEGEKATKFSPVTIEELNRVLEIGRLLLSVLTPEEREELQRLFEFHHEPCNSSHQREIP